ncbi:MAG: hypothetical protein JWR84_73 [Caulobacter sp.]|nr:hypothetical protein [Caulobacter sp.]
MADGEMTLKLDAETQATVAEAAAAAGETPEVWALKIVREAAADRARWAETMSRLEEIDRDGEETLSVEEAFDEFRHVISEERARK